ncbi:hypothetical protein NL526_27605, partial [Klebsiella pneumoniae]|nr:hypothetical protein [Klebsiella pneumoniae]
DSLIANKCFSVCNTYISIVLDGEIEKVKHHSNGKNVVKVPLSYFDDSQAIQKSIFITENSYDAEFYKYTSYLFSEVNDVPVNICFQNVPGGG